jgi:HEAT repeat protein
MNPYLSFLIVRMLLPQDDAHPRARKLIEGLRSERVTEREAATQELKNLGPTARPELEKAADDRDPEVADRARQILRVIYIREKLPLELREAIPGIEERLAWGGSNLWFDILERSTEKKLSRRCLRFLALGALSEARSSHEKERILNWIGESGCERLAPDIVRHLKDSDAGVRCKAAKALANLDAKESATELLNLLQDSDSAVRWMAGLGLAELRAVESIPGIVELLKHSKADVREAATRALGELGAKDLAPEIVKLLRDSEARVRMAAAEALGALARKEAAPEIARLLRDSDVGVRRIAAKALVELDAKETTAEFLKLLENSNADVRKNAAWALGRLGAKDTAP